MIDKKRALKDLCDLYYEQGYHSGRWTDELQMDATSEEYLETMKKFAETYEIEYDDDLSHYVQDYEYEAECYTMDAMGYDLFQTIKKKLLDIIFGDK